MGVGTTVSVTMKWTHDGAGFAGCHTTTLVAGRDRDPRRACTVEMADAALYEGGASM